MYGLGEEARGECSPSAAKKARTTTTTEDLATPTAAAHGGAGDTDVDVDMEGLLPVSTERSRPPDVPDQGMSYVELVSTSPRDTLRALAVAHPTWSRKELFPGYTSIELPGALEVALVDIKPMMPGMAPMPRPGAVPFVQSANIRATRDRAVELGATLHTDVSPVPGRGEFMYLTAPGEVFFGVFQSLPEEQVDPSFTALPVRPVPTGRAEAAPVSVVMSSTDFAATHTFFTTLFGAAQRARDVRAAWKHDDRAARH